MKICPVCGQAIQDAAIKCRYCKNWLVPPPQSSAISMLPPQPLRTTNGMAIASLVLGILWLYWLGSILALVFGYIAKREIKGNPERQDGGGLATAGIILGWIGMGTLIVAIAIIMVVAVMEQKEKQPQPVQTNTTVHAMWISPQRESAMPWGTPPEARCLHHPGL